MRILLLGKDGQVGTELRHTLKPLAQVISIGRADLNLEHLPALNNILNLHQPHIIVNAAAYTAVDKAESDKETAYIINANVVSVLAEYAKRHNALLVHYSTDYVFDGEKEGAYLETDPVNPQNIYGASKLAGEQAICQSGCDFLLFRTSWVYSATGKNFIKTILQLAKEKESLRIVADQYGAPTSAELIAEITTAALSSYQKDGLCNGIYHLTPKGHTNWHNFACYIVNKALARGIELKLHSNQIHPVATEEYPLPAKRPRNSILNSNALASTIAYPIADWTTYVDRTIDQLICSEFLV